MFGDLIKSVISPALSVNRKAPDFDLKDQNGQHHSLHQYRGKWVVLFCYPKDETFFCTKEACSFRDSYTTLTQMGAVVLGLSSDSQTSHELFSKHYALPYPLLSDPHKTTLKKYGALLPLRIPNRMTFIIDPKGFVAERIDWANWYQYGETVAKKLADLQRAPGL